MRYELSISNLQAISKLDLELEGFVVISGKTNSGKSCIRRALNVLFTNSWDEFYLRNNTDQASVTLTFNGNTLSCVRGKGHNVFSVNDKIYYKMGKAVPVEYKDLKINTLDVSDHKYNLNISSQFEPLFLVSYTIPEISRIFNQVMGVDVLEEAARLSLQDLNKLKSQYRDRVDEVKDKEADLLEMESYISQLEALLYAYQEKSALKEKLLKVIPLRKDRFSLDYDLKLLIFKQNMIFKYNQLSCLKDVYLSQQQLSILMTYQSYRQCQNAYHLAIAKHKLEMISKYKRSIYLKDLCLAKCKLSIYVSYQAYRQFYALAIGKHKLRIISHYLSYLYCKNQLKILDLKLKLANVQQQIKAFECPTCGRLLS